MSVLLWREDDEMETVETNEKPVELLTITSSHYRFFTRRGDVVLQMPASVKKSELGGIKQMFALIIEQMESCASD